MNSTTNDNILRGYTSREKAYEVKDYPYGFRLRTSIFYWIETKEGKGDRLCTYTINPKTGRANAPKCSTYSTFLYLYINDQGHVTHGSIDAYNRETFEARFYFIINKIGEHSLSEEQKKNIRSNYYMHVKLNSPYDAVKYSPDTLQDFKNWVAGKLKHILTCDFKDLVDYPEPPAQDNPNGEIKMTITQRQII